MNAAPLWWMIQLEAQKHAQTHAHTQMKPLVGVCVCVLYTRVQNSVYTMTTCDTLVVTVHDNTCLGAGHGHAHQFTIRYQQNNSAKMRHTVKHVQVQLIINPFSKNNYGG